MSKVYLPSDLIDSSYYYALQSNVFRIDIRTQNNCSGTGNNKQCDCYAVYYNDHYMRNGPYKCASPGTIGYQSAFTSEDFTSNIFYRNDMPEILLMTFILLLICFYFPYKIISRLFGRWLKI